MNGVTPWRTMSVALQANVAGYVGGLSQASAATRKFAAQQESGLRKAATGWQTFAKLAVTGLALIGVAMGLSIREAISWESAFAGVRKTVEATEAEFAALEGGIVSMANRLPASRQEIAGVAEAAGQLGVEQGAILEFSEVMIGLGESTNLGAEEAATGLARFANVMGTADFERLGSVIVDLGNNSATTEAEILDMAQRLSGAGKLIGATESDVLALAATMSSLGIESQLGGGAFSRVILGIYSAVQSGGDELEGFAAAAKMTASEFAAAFEADPIRAVDGLIQGLADTQAAGGDVVGVLADLGIKGTQDLQVVLRLLGAGDQLVDSLNLGAQAWEENSALADEVAQRYATAESQLRIFANKTSNVARIVGAALIPALLGGLDAAERLGRWMIEVGGGAADRLAGFWGDLVDTGTNLADIFDAIWDSARPAASAVAQLGGAGVLGALSALGSSLEAVTGFLADNEAAVAVLIGSLAALAGAKSWTLLVSAAETTYLKFLYMSEGIRARYIVQQLGIVARGFATMATSATVGASMVTGAISNIANMSVSGAAIAGGALAGLAIGWYVATQSLARSAKHGQEAAERFIDALDIDPSSTQSMLDGLVAINVQIQELSREAGRSNWTQVRQRLNPWDENTIDEAEEELERLRIKHEELAETIGRLHAVGRELDLNPGQVDAFRARLNLDPETQSVEEMGEAIREAANAARNGTPATDAIGESFAVLADETASASDQLRSWLDLVDEVIGAEKSIFDARTSWEAGIDAFTASLIENGRTLDANTEQGRNNRQALSGLVDDAISLAEAYGRTGNIEAANLVLEASRQKIIETGEAAGLSTPEITAWLEELGLTPDNVDTLLSVSGEDEASRLLEQHKRNLADVPRDITTLVRVRMAVDGDVAALAGNPYLTIIDGQVVARNRLGGITSYATGGIHRQAMMGSGRGMVHWDEPETGKEAYVPMKSPTPWRSLAVLSEAASWFGMGLVPANATAMAQGGIMGGPVPRQPPLIVQVQGSTGGGATTTNNWNISGGTDPRAVAREIERRMLFQ